MGRGPEGGPAAGAAGLGAILEPEDETLKGIYPRLVTAKNRFAAVVVLAGPRC